MIGAAAISPVLVTPSPNTSRPASPSGTEGTRGRFGLNDEKDQKPGASSQETANPKASSNQLTEEEQKQVEELKKINTEIIAHEQAHARVGGQYAGAPRYSYQTGPDGKRYAVAGSVSIDISPVANDPEATIRKMDVVRAAALAPAEPSSQDYKVAAKAQQTQMQARAELAKLNAQELRGEGEDSINGFGPSQSRGEQQNGINGNPAPVGGAVGGLESLAKSQKVTSLYQTAQGLGRF